MHFLLQTSHCALWFLCDFPEFIVLSLVMFFLKIYELQVLELEKTDRLHLQHLKQILLANSPKRRGLKRQSGKCASWRAASGGANPPTDTSRGPRPSRFLASSFWPDPHSASDAARRRAPLARSCPPPPHGAHTPDETPHVG